jgi:hypothetical protein
MNFPRYVYAIGGAGKNLLYTTLENEWILRELLRPQFAPTEVDVMIIDTAIIEENSDRGRIAEIEKNVARIEEEYRSNPLNTGQNIGRINITYKLLTKEMSLQSPHALIGIEDKVKKATGAKTWWINDSELGQDWSQKLMTKNNFQELNFSKGVYRKRAMGKAIFYKAISEGLFNININRSDKIDIVIGLGGGTGSGIAFDLARTVKNIQPTADVTLFGVLSTLNESPDEKANNFAMLGEIEHAYINGISPFKNVILIPMEVTEFPGREKASDIHERLLREFDETVPHIFVACHNNPAERLLTGFPSYAPFVIATSQVVRYNVESIKKLKDNLVGALSDKETSLKDEDDIYSIIRKFVDEFYPEEFQKGLSEDDKIFVKERLSKFNMVLNHELFRELNYNGVVILRKAVEDGISGSGSDEIEKQVMSIKSETDMISIGSEGYKEETDKTLYNILKKDVDAIDMLLNILSMVNNNVKNDLIRETLKIVAKADEDRSRNKLNKIREELNTLTIRKKQADAAVRTLEDGTNSYREKVVIQVNRNHDEWKQNEIRNIESLDKIDALSPTLNNDFSMLKTELGEYAHKIMSIKSVKALEVEPTKSIEDLINKIGQEMEPVGIYYVDKGIIMKSLTNLKEFKKAQIESAKSIPFLDKILRTNRVGKAREAKNKAMLKTAELSTDKIFDVSGSVVSGTYDYNIGNRISDKKEEILDAITNRIGNKFPKTAPSLLSDLRDVLRSPEKRREASIREIVLSDLGYDMDINKSENDIKARNTEIVGMSKDITIYKTLETVITKNIKDLLSSHVRHLKNYHDTIGNMGKDVIAMHKAKKDTVRYVMDIQPTNVYKATIAGANINNILEDRGEELILRQNLRDAINRTVDVRYNMLVRRVIENEKHDKRWSRSKVLNAFVTIANIDLAVIDSDDIIVHAFDIDKVNRSEWKSSWGDSWGVGMVLFVTGVPLDNIRSATDPSSGYYRYYKESEKTSLIFLHHSYMLEEGRFVKRKGIFNFEKEEDKDMLLQNDEIVEKVFSGNYEENKLADVFKIGGCK